LTALEGSVEALSESLVVVEAMMLITIAKVGSLNVGSGSNAHTEETSEHGGRGADQEREGGVGEGNTLDEVNCEVDDDRKNDCENCKVGVLFFEESTGTLLKC